jgi:dynein heavy chain, axonemal
VHPGFFITMNPGYAGRQELPANLKVLFRSVAMMVPEREIIMKVKLAAVGFLHETPLAHKFDMLYRLCEQQLSKQRHYDFGLRSVLAVLRSCGAAKRAAGPSQRESEILMRVVRDMNVSKLVDADIAIFQTLIEDLFPKIAVRKAEYPGLETSLVRCAKESDLALTPHWQLKVIQLYEVTLVRHGVIVMGDPGSGKTAAIKLLQDALTDAGQAHKMVTLNPKAAQCPD